MELFKMIFGVKKLQRPLQCPSGPLPPVWPLGSSGSADLSDPFIFAAPKT